ncbi:energy-coupling factor ABC transporter ATP-binding protein [Bombilactobacillus folatiphilus]|uniref:Energy-coupling factor ABC transporter ATP-binding protein n=1 Tax=Bombilactobacillus folatiphilus TaxID=2923362 RepID=A0ABY4PA23_9LACO|nr:energy-coupling factor ABC transporter ATP-binding protein [Bombilactobacillus folatiphilus]UQS82381.1 energy-coupling factor ABC transporter ATP-binding protein [Bombilactobacillus folatiphilus]
MENIIQLDDVTYSYEEASTPTLNHISFAVQANQWVAIIGQNGSGKSTLARVLNGLLEPNSGQVKIGGMLLTEDTVWQIRQQLGIIFQNPDHQFVGATVEDDVAFGLENQGMKRSQMIERVQWALELVNMTDFAKRSPQVLSGGQKQRVAIAGIIALKPQIVIMDEATSMLDPQGRHDILLLIKRLQRELGMTVLSITHDLNEITQADQVIVLQKGNVLKIGNVEQIFADPTKLLSFGLQAPFTQRLQLDLQQHDVAIDSNYVTKQELVQKLWQLHLNT